MIGIGRSRRPASGGSVGTRRLRARAAFVLLAAAPFIGTLATRETAQADEVASATVVVLAPSQSALGRRVAAELAAMGLTVRMRAVSSESLDDVARDLHVDGVVRVTHDALDVWLHEPFAARTVRETVPLGTTEAQQVTAVHRATEILRTQLFEPMMARASASAAAVSPPASTSADTPAPTESSTFRGPSGTAERAAPTATPTTTSSAKPPAVVATQTGPQYGVWLGPRVVWSGPVTQTSVDLAAGAYARVLGPLFLEASIDRSLTTTSVAATAGSAQIESWMFGLAGRLRFGSARFGAGGGLGLAGVWLLLTGHAVAPYRSDRADVLTVMPFAVAGVDFSPVAHFAIRADVIVGATTPRASVVFADQTVADWGSPLLAARLAAEARFP